MILSNQSPASNSPSPGLFPNSVASMHRLTDAKKAFQLVPKCANKGDNANTNKCQQTRGKIHDKND